MVIAAGGIGVRLPHLRATGLFSSDDWIPPGAGLSGAQANEFDSGCGPPSLIFCNHKSQRRQKSRRTTNVQRAANVRYFVSTLMSARFSNLRRQSSADSVAVSEIALRAQVRNFASCSAALAGRSG